MVVLKLQGGLGNQLFQYLAYQRLSERFDEVYLDVTEYNLPFNNGYRKFDLDSFTTNKLRFVVFSDSLKKLIYYKVFNRKIKNFKTIVKNQLEYFNSEKTGCLSDDLHEICDNSYVEGWFSNERFVSNFSKLFLFFNPSVLANESIERAYNAITNCNSISVHIRRTDYITESDKYGGICTEEYYHKALDFFRKKTVDPVFFFFSDDIEWCKQTFFSNDIKFIDEDYITHVNDTVEDLFLMSCCKHNILANSTYSWWAAYFNKNKQKTVVRPKYWSANNDGRNIYCKEWIFVD